MRPLLRVLFPLLAAGALAACASSERLPDARYTMVEHQVLPLTPRVNITYEGAEDSRCPEHVRCVWPGQVAYRFTLRIGTVAQAFYLVPGRAGYTSPALRGSRIELDRNLVAPPPGMVDGRPASYPVTFNMYAM